MLKRIGCFFTFCLFPLSILAVNPPITPNDCTTRIFSDALIETMADIDPNAPEIDIRKWVLGAFSSKTTLGSILECPEITSISDTDTIKFTPIQHTFSNGRKIVINYETQPKLLKQRLKLLTKRPLPSDEISPRIGPDSDSLWTNTDPAWYGIMVVEHGALDEFVGPDKNNTISLKYIEENIDSLYPSGIGCTNKSALANDVAAINRATTNAIGIKEQTGEKDTNDYYVAGDVNLQWISYFEIALDVALTVVTWGGSAIASGALKATRAGRSLDNLKTVIKTLSKTEDVQKYINAVRAQKKTQGQINSLKNATKEIDELKKIKNKLNKLDQTKDAKQYEKLKKQADELTESITKRGHGTDLDDINKQIKENQENLKTINKEVNGLKSKKDVAKYRESVQASSDLKKLIVDLRRLRKPQRGNVIARTAKTTKALHRARRAAFSGNDILRRANKLGRRSTFSGQMRDWLFDSSLKSVGILTNASAKGAALYGAIKFVGDMYDYTTDNTNQYTNGIKFKPLLLLSADDIAGQENVVNYGMWILFAGSSTDSNDDDAAYLQAMDFASKFYEDLYEIQNEKNSPCNVDIFVVRPIIRNLDTENAELFYLIMNDEPWTTNQ